MELQHNLTDLREQAAYLAANLQSQIGSPIRNLADLPSRPPSMLMPEHQTMTPQPFPYSPFSTAVRLEQLDLFNPMVQTQPRFQVSTEPSNHSTNLPTRSSQEAAPLPHHGPLMSTNILSPLLRLVPATSIFSLSFCDWCPLRIKFRRNRRGLCQRKIADRERFGFLPDFRLKPNRTDASLEDEAGAFALVQLQEVRR
eukprot:1061984-Prorocentrum_minimum.AAC.2